MDLDHENLNFGNPPLMELVLKVQFDTIENLHIGMIGVIWNEFRDRYPHVKIDHELQPLIERFGIIQRPQPTFKFSEQPTVPRALFVSDDDSHIVQIQNNMFISNWRAGRNQDRYPRFPSLKDKFLSEYKLFQSVLQANNIAFSKINQIESYYINHIPIEKGDTVSKVFTCAIDEVKFPEALKMEGFKTNFNHVISYKNKPIGRLHTSIEKAQRLSDGEEIFVLNLLARTNPLSESEGGIEESLELLRNTVNRSFLAVTSPSMHKKWERFL